MNLEPLDLQSNALPLSYTPLHDLIVFIVQANFYRLSKCDSTRLNNKKQRRLVERESAKVVAA